MKKLSTRTPQTAILDLHRAFIPIDHADPSSLELSIRISNADLSIRDLSAFLEIVDRVFGRMSEKGLKSYAQKGRDHLRIKDIKQGSWELILQETITSGYSHALVVLYLVIKYLPPAFQSISSTYNNYEQGRLARISRKRIKAEMENDQRLNTLSNDRLNQIARLIENIHEKESERLNRAIRFSKNGLLDIEIRAIGEEESSDTNKSIQPAAAEQHR